ncbi:MAG: PLP-dependent aspartate aminotransferase family protein [Acidimicrobiia bacterium]|nr:PLP-dependent aspartate aminotransferase family protein [Acidimicrobiia bacterium]
MPENSDLDLELATATKAVQAGLHRDSITGAANPAIQLSTTFHRDADYQLPGDFNYARTNHPNAAALESVAAQLDGGESALAFASGMAAISALFNTIPAGAHAMAPRIMYHGAQDLLIKLSETKGFALDLYEHDREIESLMRPGQTDLVWVETPTNPMWDVIDIESAAVATRAGGATLAVDSTVAPPPTTRPLELGADIVFHSATKYYGGHSDVIGGLLIAKSDERRWPGLIESRTLNGSILAPFDAWLVLRGLRTLFVRYERSSANAMAVAKHLTEHPAVARVLYPGLESHPGHGIASRQMTGGYGGMLSLLLAGGEPAARRMASRTKVFVPATSLGGVESLIEHRVAAEGPNSIVPPDLVRLSVGIEDVNDLIADLGRALDQDR